MDGSESYRRGTGTTFGDRSREGDQRSAAIDHALFGIVPIVVTVSLLRLFMMGNGRLFANDFQDSYWPAARKVLRGASPYIAPRFSI